MSKTKLVLAAGLMLTLCGSLFLAGCGGDSGATVHKDTTEKKVADKDAATGKHKVYLITMDSGSNFWQLVDEGCRQAVSESGDVDYKWVAPPNHEVQEQKECIEKAVADGAEAIVISAISETDLNDTLKKAVDKGVKLVYVDSAATFEAIATLKTDSEEAGKVAARTMQEALGKAGITSGTIGVAAIGPEAQNAILRVKGFRSVFEGTPFTIAPTAYMYNERQNIKNDVKNHPEYVAWFGSNEQMTRAISEEIKELGSKQIIVGFDTSDFMLSMINEGIIYATMQQNPKKMGHDGVEIALKAIKGEFKDKNVMTDMGVNVITKEKI